MERGSQKQCAYFKDEDGFQLIDVKKILAKFLMANLMKGLSNRVFFCSFFLKRKKRPFKVQPLTAQDTRTKRERDQIFHMLFGISPITLCNMTALSQHNALGRNDKRRFSQLHLKKPQHFKQAT